MEIVQIAVLLMIAVVGTVIVKTREPIAQAIVLSFYGLLMAILFVVLQAPAAALSQIVVGAVVLPLMIVLAVARVRRRTR
jgi:energy-converting hydrogenase B subunit D